MGDVSEMTPDEIEHMITKLQVSQPSSVYARCPHYRTYVVQCLANNCRGPGAQDT